MQDSARSRLWPMSRSAVRSESSVSFGNEVKQQAAPQLFAGRVRDLEAATRPAGAVTAFGSRRADNVTDEALHHQAHRGMLTGECRERARGATNHERAISFHASNRSELLVHKSACESDSGFQCPGWPCSST